MLFNLMQTRSSVPYAYQTVRTEMTLSLRMDKKVNK